MNPRRNSRRPRKAISQRPSKTVSTHSLVVASGRGSAAAVFENTSRAIEELSDLHAEVQKQFTIWSKNPPLTSNRQQRFANKLEEWAARGNQVIRGLQEAAKAGERLPGFGHCSHEEKVARRVLAGLKAMHTEEMLATLLGQLQAFANRARQALSGEQSKKLWDEFSAFVIQLGGALGELNAITLLIQEALQHSGQASDRADSWSLAMRHCRITSQRPPPESRAIKSGTDSMSGLEKLDHAIDKLRSGIGRILKDLANLSKIEGVRASLLAQHEEILFALTQYEHQAEVFCAFLEQDEECKELIECNIDSPLSKITLAVRRLLYDLEQKSTWCAAWLNVIRMREAAAFTLPKELPKQLGDFIRSVTKIRETLRERLGNRHARSSPPAVRDRVSLNPDDRRVLQCMLVSTGSGNSLTVKNLAAASGFGQQKVRRILKDRLGRGGVGIVKRKKPPRGRGNISPADLFYIEPDDVETARHLVQHP